MRFIGAFVVTASGGLSSSLSGSEFATSVKSSLSEPPAAGAASVTAASGFAGREASPVRREEVEAGADSTIVLRPRPRPRSQHHDRHR